MGQKVGEPGISFWNVNKKGFEDEIGGLNIAIMWITTIGVKWTKVVLGQVVQPFERLTSTLLFFLLLFY
jgi:hypothetical protein